VDGVEQEEPGVNELAAYIVSFVKNEVIELVRGAGFGAKDIIDEAVLRIAKDEIKKGAPGGCANRR